MNKGTELKGIIGHVNKSKEYIMQLEATIANLRRDNQMLKERLDAIENSNPSEALKYFETISIGTIYYDECNIIKQALLKAQEQESKIEILKEYRKDYLDRLKNLEKHSQNQEKENTKYKQLEEQIGCPLDVFLDLFIHNKPFYYEDENKKIHLIERYEFYNNNLIIFGRYNGCSVYLKDHKKTWWLRKDRSK